MKDLGTLGGTFGNAFWINEAGDVVGLASLPGDQVFHAFLWKNGVMTDLGTLKGDPLSVALGVNSKGQVVGNSGTPSSVRGFLWENGSMFDLNTPVSPAAKLNLSFPSIINDRGEIAGQVTASQWRHSRVPADPM
jgi:probable HAF family extracellular repeat protein